MFWGTTVLFSMAPFYIPISSMQSFSFSTALPKFVIFWFLDSRNCITAYQNFQVWCHALLIFLWEGGDKIRLFNYRHDNQEELILKGLWCGIYVLASGRTPWRLTKKHWSYWCEVTDSRVFSYLVQEFCSCSNFGSACVTWYQLWQK